MIERSDIYTGGAALFWQVIQPQPAFRVAPAVRASHFSKNSELFPQKFGEFLGNLKEAQKRPKLRSSGGFLGHVYALLRGQVSVVVRGEFGMWFGVLLTCSLARSLAGLKLLLVIGIRCNKRASRLSFPPLRYIYINIKLYKV